LLGGLSRIEGLVDGAVEAVLLTGSWITSDRVFVAGSTLGDSLVLSLTLATALVLLMERFAALLKTRS
jgi:hypothetical protein